MSLVLMTKNGAFMNCYNQQQIARTEAKGWTVVPEKKKLPKKSPAKYRTKK